MTRLARAHQLLERFLEITSPEDYSVLVADTDKELLICDDEGKCQESAQVHILQRLYDSEIDCGISTIWDTGFEWWVAPDSDDFSTSGRADTYEAAVEAVRQVAIRLYPESEFAKAEKA